MNLFIIDGISPFFKGYRKGKRINWSKLPFEYLEKDGKADVERLDQISRDFEVFCERAAAMGYNAITLDDLAHMVPHSDYGPDINAKLEIYARYYKKWIQTALDHQLAIYITTDFMFYTEASRRSIGSRFGPALERFRELLHLFFQTYPEVSGLILRIGETDGKDVKGDFISRLLIKTPAQARRLLREVLPVFEQAGRDLIFRLWSVGAYPIGDLQWNRKTLMNTFGPFDSQRLILSIKYGESDFFRFLPLNKQFFRSPHKKIIELQSRREYEGCGEYPSFVGYDYEAYEKELVRAENVVGMSVWCNTGGWTRFGKLTFMENSSVWNDINTWVSLRIFRYGETADNALQEFANTYFKPEQGPALIQMMGCSDRAIKDLLYIDCYANRKLFFRRVRLPSILHVYWDRILIMHPVRKVLRCFVEDGEAKVAQGERGLAQVERLRTIARESQLPDDGLDFMYDTFQILSEARRYYFLPFEEAQVKKLKQLKKAYRSTYDTRYAVRLKPRRFTIRSRTIRLFFNIMLREKRGYRVVDHVFTVRVLAVLFPLIARIGQRIWPKFMHKQAMGLETVFK